MERCMVKVRLDVFENDTRVMSSSHQAGLARACMPIIEDAATQALPVVRALPIIRPRADAIETVPIPIPIKIVRKPMAVIIDDEPPPAPRATGVVPMLGLAMLTLALAAFLP